MSDRTFRSFSDEPHQCYYPHIRNFPDSDSTLLQPTEGALKNWVFSILLPSRCSYWCLHMPPLCSLFHFIGVCAHLCSPLRNRARGCERHESILRMCWISVFTFPVPSFPRDCLSLLMFEVGCRAVLHPRAHVLGGGGGVWGGERWGVWVNPCRIADSAWVGVCWALFKKKHTHTLFADPRTRACILHAFAGVCLV